MTTSCVAVLTSGVLTSILPSTDAEQPRAELGDGMSNYSSHGIPVSCLCNCFRISVSLEAFQLATTGHSQMMMTLSWQSVSTVGGVLFPSVICRKGERSTQEFARARD